MFRDTEKICWDFRKKIDVGIILEQSWMFSEVIKQFKGGRLFYWFLVDRYAYLVEKNGKKYLLLSSNGASIIACRVEEMVRLGAEKVFRVGTCGSLQKDVEVGDIVLSFAAIKDEGTSLQYVPLEFPSVTDPYPLLAFLEKLKEKKLNVHLGITWSTDGRFVESNKKILLFSKLGVKNVDMETSAFLTVCWVKRISGISLGIVTDKPIEDLKEEFKGSIKNLSSVKKMVCKILPAIISTIFESD